MIKFIKKMWAIEAIRYLFVGGTAFVADKLAFWLFNTFILPDLGSWWLFQSLTNAVAVFIGFIVGTIVNNMLSMYVVFVSDEQKEKRNVKTFWLFTLIGVIGLLLSIGGNALAIRLFGEGKTRELVYNILIAIPVTVWNYIGRRFCVRKGKTHENHTEVAQ